MVLIAAYKRHDRLLTAVQKRLREELPNSTWKSMKRRAESETSVEATALVFWGSIFAVLARDEGYGERNTRGSSQN